MSIPSAESPQSVRTNGSGRQPLATKPRRVWIFQALLALQLISALAGTLSAALSLEVRELPVSEILRGFIRPILGVPIVTALILALQRLTPRPSHVAPALAALWWTGSLVSHFAPGAPFNQGLASLPPWIGKVALHALLLWFVVSTWTHRETRAYLASQRSLR